MNNMTCTQRRRREEGPSHSLGRILKAGVGLQARVVHPLHLRMRFEKLGKFQRVVANAIHSQGQCLQTLQQHPRPEWILTHAEVTKTLDSSTHRERDVCTQRPFRPEAVSKDQAVVPGAWFREQRKLGRLPVESATVDDDAADRCPMTTNPLRR